MFLWRKNIPIIVYVNDYRFTNVMDNNKLTKKYLPIFPEESAVYTTLETSKNQKVEVWFNEIIIFLCHSCKDSKQIFYEETNSYSFAYSSSWMKKDSYTTSFPYITHKHMVHALY